MGAAPPMTSMPMAVAPPLAGPGQIPAPAPAAAQEEVDPLEAFRQSVRDRTARRREEERQAILNPPPPMPVGQAARQAFTGGEATNVVEDLQNRQNAIQRILNWLRGD